MRTLYIADHSARIRIRKSNVVVERSAEATRVPIETLESVVLLGRADITNDALGELTRRGVNVAALSKTGRLRFRVGGPTSGNVLLRLAQCSRATDAEAALDTARSIVAGKLQNCRRMVARWQSDATGTAVRASFRIQLDGISDRISAISTARDGDTLRGVEGDASRRYFKAMGLHLRSVEDVVVFQRRSRRPPRDPFNALMSFLYGLTLAEVAGALDAVGLDPQIGFLHQPRPGRPSLALDLLEELRPAIDDRFAVAAWSRRQIRPEHFETMPGNAVYLSDEGRRLVLSLWDRNRQGAIAHPLLGRSIPIAILPHVQATLMARHLRGDLPSYAPYTLAA
jgi:CRISPR-associated protein Cas1